MPNLGRLWRYFRREIIHRRIPHGLLGPGYLWPRQDQRIRLHRQFWWASSDRWPRLIWVLVEFWLWLRWQLWHAVPACWRAVRKLGPGVEAEEGIPRLTQGRRVLKQALLWCIPPWESYRFRLYREPGMALDYVFDAETQAYHAWRNEGLGFTPDSQRLLQDKSGFAEVMQKEGIPVVPALARVPRNSNDMTPLLDGLRSAGRVFCKMNSGNQGRGAFTAWVTPEGLAGRTFTGRGLSETSAVETAWRDLLSLDSALVQPCLENHSRLAPLAVTGEAITVRFISQWEDGGPDRPSKRLSCLGAVLEVPAGSGAKGLTHYAMLPVRAETGELGAPLQPLSDAPAVREAAAHVATAASALAVLPEWERLAEASYRAHRLFPDVRAIAWDWVITPLGPVLLEGNTGWGTSVPQLCLREGLVNSSRVMLPVHS